MSTVSLRFLALGSHILVLILISAGVINSKIKKNGSQTAGREHKFFHIYLRHILYHNHLSV